MIEPLLHLSQLLDQPLARLREQLALAGDPLPEGLLEALASDPRRGARALCKQWQERQDAQQREKARLARLLAYERIRWERGSTLVAGVDEAGVGPLAGPLAAAAVILPPQIELASVLPGLDDSKRLPPSRRQLLADQIRASALAWSVVFVEVEEIDRLNVYQAGLLAMRRAVESLPLRPEQLLVDARTIPDCQIPQEGLIRGDARSASIAAASVLAKTARDQHMSQLDARYPGYGLAIHQGYPTAAHLEAIQRLGLLPIHRRSFRPVRELLGVETPTDSLSGQLATSLPLFPLPDASDLTDATLPHPHQPPPSSKGVYRR
jgi:ribonuclease HII